MHTCKPSIWESEADNEFEGSMYHQEGGKGKGKWKTGVSIQENTKICIHG